MTTPTNPKGERPTPQMSTKQIQKTNAAPPQFLSVRSHPLSTCRSWISNNNTLGKSTLVLPRNHAGERGRDAFDHSFL